MQEGLKAAVGVPLSLAERINTLWPVLKEMVKYGNVACKSDIQVRLDYIIILKNMYFFMLVMTHTRRKNIISSKTFSIESQMLILHLEK